MDWIYQNIGNIIVVVLILISVSGAIIKIQRTGRKTGSSSGCGSSTTHCSGCPYSGSNACGKQR